MRGILIGFVGLASIAGCSGGDMLGDPAGGASISGATAGSGAAGTGATGNSGSSGGVVSAGGTSGNAGAAGGSGVPASSGSAVSDGGAGQLPCDVSQVLTATCQGCHSSPPIAGAPMPLVTYANLTAPAVSDPTKNVAEMCVARMQSSTRPMPPSPAMAASASAIATIQNWIGAGYPMGTCGDGGAAAPNPYNTPVTCTSHATYSGGDTSSVMSPGQACISCHTAQGGPSFTIGGTVYPTAHEPNNCNGVNGAADGATVVITDSAGTVFTLKVNTAGNFYENAGNAAIAMPLRAKVVQGGKERVMATPQNTGDCNSCHTETGTNNAPGRIMLP